MRLSEWHYQPRHVNPRIQVLKWALFVLLNILLAIPIAEMLRVVYQAWHGLFRRILSEGRDKAKANV